MKVLTKSPSISSSASSAFDTNMCVSRNATGGGCLAALLRRILCSCALPKHTSNSDLITRTLSNSDHDSQPSVSPCIVARLMGLDSIPDLITSHSKIPKMNSVEKSTLSMRKLPEFLEIKNNEFIEFSFEIRRKSQEKRKSEVGFGESKKYTKRGKRRNRVNKVEVTKLDLENNIKVLNEEIYATRRRITDENCHQNLDPMKINSSLSTEIVKKSKSSSSIKLKNKKKKKIASNRLVNYTERDQCSSEESSPVSVLDFGHFIIDPENPNSEEVCPRSAQVNSKRKLSPELENYSNPSSSNLISSDQKAKDQYNNKNYMEIWCKANRLTMAEIKSSIWNSKIEDFDDMSSHFGSQILDTLLGASLIFMGSADAQLLPGRGKPCGEVLYGNHCKPSDCKAKCRAKHPKNYQSSPCGKSFKGNNSCFCFFHC